MTKEHREYSLSATQQDLLEQVTNNTEATRKLLDPTCPQLGRIADIDEDNRLWLDFASLDFLLEAYTSTPLYDYDIGRDCLVSFIDHDLNQPVVTGLIHTPNETAKSVTIKASEELTLECGNGRITLDAHGKVNIRGQSINSQSYGANRIKGGSVKLN
ncbi:MULTISPECIES: DUF6484 domain-containing protein [Vibrio]|uniref:DUF6484 domain-containing protein n=1 Tax=Vibrio TaxID=662 RepID=UPI00069397E7|nr:MULTISPECIES: DUF6484 domain-containing protein [Vibrio]USD49179.1 hypothetical protein J4N37_11200 [Vibrio sp. SCSIO 43153]